MNNQHAQEMLELIIEGLDSLTDSHRLRVEQEIVAGAGCIPAYGLPCHHDSAVARCRNPHDARLVEHVAKLRDCCHWVFNLRVDFIGSRSYQSGVHKCYFQKVKW